MFLGRLIAVALQLVNITKQCCDKEEIPLQIGVIFQERVLDYFHELYVCGRIKSYTKKKGATFSKVLVGV